MGKSTCSGYEPESGRPDRPISGFRPFGMSGHVATRAEAKCLVSAADICPVSTADISISIHYSASAFSVNNHHIMEAATAADFWLL